MTPRPRPATDRKVNGSAGLSIDFVRGKPPRLIMLDETTGEEIERIDLAPYSTDELHELVVSKDFEKLATPEPDAAAAAQADAVADAETTL